MTRQEIENILSNIKDGETFTLKFETHPNGLNAQAKKDGYDIVKKTVAAVKTGLDYVPANPSTGPSNRTSHIKTLIKNRLLENTKTGKILLRVNVDEETDFMSTKEMYKDGAKVEWDDTKLVPSYMKPKNFTSNVLSIGIDNISEIVKL